MSVHCKRCPKRFTCTNILLAAIGGCRVGQVATEEAQAYADENGLVFWETSAKTAANVTELFEDLAGRLPKSAPPPPTQGGITLADPPAAPKKTTCCATS